MQNKNVAIPDDLMSVVEKVARAEGKTPDQVVEAAARRYILREQLDRLARDHEARVRELGITEEDVPALVKEWRQEQRARE